jgi:hypothetical protein
VIAPTLPTIIITPTLPSSCTAPATTGTVSLQIQVTPPAGIGVVDVTVNFGDPSGSSADLGGLTGTTTITHPYPCGSAATVAVNVKDTLGRTTTGTTSFKMP